MFLLTPDKPELGNYIIIGVCCIMILGSYMQYLRSIQIREMQLRPAGMVINLSLIIVFLLVYLLLAMVVLNKVLVL